MRGESLKSCGFSCGSLNPHGMKSYRNNPHRLLAELRISVEYSEEQGETLTPFLFCKRVHEGLNMPQVQFRVFRCLAALAIAFATCLTGSPCRTGSSAVDNALVCSNGDGCRGLLINGQHACAALPFDFKRAAETARAAVPRLPAGPLGASTFQLHSRPGATKVIYLDFDGHTTQNTQWNSSSTPTIVTTAFDMDSNPGTFNSTEQAVITEIWQRVAECYSPWDVDVTTEAPAVADLINNGGSDTKWGMRVLFGVSTPNPAPGAGGVAYLYSFGKDLGNGFDEPCFVLQQGMGTGAKVNADACVHEVGHTLGMSHDGRSNPVEGYYQGHGSGKVSWAPHMGVGYYVSLVQWSKGEYLNANNQEDDMNKIATLWGFGYRPDDFANSTTAAKAIAGSAGTNVFNVNTSGVIETSADADWFKIVCATGAVKLDAVGGPANTMLDIQLSLYDSKGNLIVASNPPTDVIASINQTVGAGTYYAKIEGVGLGDPLGTGYTDYSSVGQYTITGSYSTKGLAGAPVLTVATDMFYGVKDSPKPINPNIKVADPDNTTLAGATVKITNVVSTEDLLSIKLDSSMGNITSSYSASTGTLTLTSAGATATLAQMEAALRAVSYSNSKSSPTATPRRIEFQVNDGTISSNPLTSMVTIGFTYINVAYDAGTKTMTITDDPGDNAFSIALRGSQIVVESAGSTRIGNSTSSKSSLTFDYSGDLKLNITCGKGNDTVSIVGLKSSLINASMGDGNDVMNLTYCNIGTLNLYGEAGVDVLNLVGTTITTKNFVQ